MRVELWCNVSCWPHGWWRRDLRVAQEAATAALVAPARAADRRNGACRGARSNVVHSAQQGQKTASSGTRPEPLEEVSEPQGGAVTVGYVAAAVPSVARPAMAAPTAHGVDVAALSFLLAHSSEEKEKERAKVKRQEEEERRMQRINEVVRVELPLTHEEREAWRRWIASSSLSSSGKRRKRRLLRTSSLSSPRRRLRQRHMQGWSCWFRSYAVSPTFCWQA